MTDKETIRQRTLEAAHLQEIEGNPLDADQMAMFEMFDREGFSPEQEIEYIRADIERRKLARETQSVTLVDRGVQAGAACSL
ncbi:hypothetical protein [Neorhizobium alkalisoli]|uniref:Antitoxin VbhA domain-containing protein n=1 Tax=Neorhizobium alkalisoli TaxID=528178 RepID=A0A561QP84_9HYPH|nr:hypothetical protein [Neorhizobium alkalisoli]TWF52096.1 hypothetical protein FHW37_105195 [Neorhizobium alkalisoli]